MDVSTPQQNISDPSQSTSTRSGANTTILMNPPASYSSDGPTIGNTPIGDVAGDPQTEKHGNVERGVINASKKRKRKEKTNLENGSSTTISYPKQNTTRNNNEKLGSKKEENKDAAQRTREALFPLYEHPWTLLPPDIHRSVSSQLGGENDDSWEKNVIPIVYTKNQNIRTAVRSLETLLKDHEPRKIIAISAQGEGTTKLVGIVELIERECGKEGGENTILWYTYTCLSSRVVEERHKNGGDEKGKKKASVDAQGEEEQEEDGEEEDAAFEQRDQSSEKSAEKKTMRVPVLTVWMSRRQLSGFGDAFGEERVFVRGQRGE